MNFASPLKLTKLLHSHGHFPFVENSRPQPWKMNLLASSETRPGLFFFAVDCNLHAYWFDLPEPLLLQTLVPPTNPIPSSDNSVNFVKTGYLGSLEIVCCVYSTGLICYWWIDDLNAVPCCLRADESAWGLAINAEKALIAVSTNSHRITVWDLKNHPSELSTKRRRINDWPLGKGQSKRLLVGHKHNIPCVDINRTGDLLLSCSVDSCCLLWSLDTGNVLKRFEFSNGAWGWSVRFIDDTLRIPKLYETKLKEKYDSSKYHTPIAKIYQKFSMVNIYDKLLESEDEIPPQPQNQAREVEVELCYPDEKPIDSSIGVSHPPRSPAVRNSQLILAASNMSLYLLRHKEHVKRLLTPLSFVNGVVAYNDRRNDRIDVFDRLNMMQWIPCLSTILIASQKGQLAILRVVEIIGQDGILSTELWHQGYLPPTSQLPNYPLLGFTVIPVLKPSQPLQNDGDMARFRLIMVYFNGLMFCYDLCLDY